MKRYLLIVASLFMAACSSSYYVWNNTPDDVSAEKDGDKVTIAGR